MKQIAATLEITTKSNMLLLAATLKSLYLGVNVTCSIILIPVKQKRSNSAWALHVRSYPRMHVRSYPRLGAGFPLSAYRACAPKDEFGGRESIFWAIVRP